MAVEFVLAGQQFVALNGGPQFTFSEAISFQIHCDAQDEVDHYWSKLTEGGEEGPCGWLKDRFGLSWQVVPVALLHMMSDPDPKKPQRVTKAFMQMKKFDIATLERAYDRNLYILLLSQRGVTMQVLPYLQFDGHCEEAIEFYKTALGAEVEQLMRFKDAPTSR